MVLAFAGYRSGDLRNVRLDPKTVFVHQKEDRRCSRLVVSGPNALPIAEYGESDLATLRASTKSREFWLITEAGRGLSIITPAVFRQWQRTKVLPDGLR